MEIPTASHADPVVPILLALVVLTAASVVGGRLMKLLGQPTVLGELMGLLLGNLAYFLGNPIVTVLREGDNLRKIVDLALSSNVSLSQAALRLMPEGTHAQRIADILSGAKGLDYVAVYSFVDLLSRIAILVLLFLIGLETSVSEMKRVGRTAFYVAVIGVVAPMALGMFTLRLRHPDSVLARDLFVGHFDGHKRGDHSPGAARFATGITRRGAGDPRRSRAG
jgi:Kef-type K+ transport system membrane component KefB